MSGADRRSPANSAAGHDAPAPDAVHPRTIETVRPFVRGGRGLASTFELELRAGAALAPDALSSTLPLDWQAEALAFVQRTCAERREAGSSWLTLPPTALVGDKGAGRIHYARQLARHARLPYHVWNLSREKPGDAPSPNAIALPPEPLTAMLASGCANPVVVVVGIDEASPAMIEQVAGMVDPRTNRRRVEHSIGATVDYSNVSWIVVSTTAEMLPVELERVLHPLRLFGLSMANYRLAALGAIDEAAFDLGLGHVPSGVRLDDVTGRSVPTRFADMYVRAHDAVQAHAHDR